MTSPRSFRRSKQSFVLVPAALAFVWLGLFAAAGQDVRSYGVVKGQGFSQTNTGPGVLEGAVLQAFVSANGDGVVTNAVIHTPGGAIVPFDLSQGSEFKQSFPSTNELNAAYPDGIYTLDLGTVHDADTTNTLDLTGDAYPAEPHLSNFSAAQAVDPAVPFTLTWDPISGATSNDFLQVEISDCTGQRVLHTPSPDEPGAWNGTVTSFPIAARGLRPGQQYEVTLLVGRFVSVNTNSYPGAKGFAGYFARVRAGLATTGTPTPCPVGRFELVFSYPQFGFGGSTQGMVNFPQGISYYLAMFNLENTGNTNFPPNVTFTGPGGSGLNNTTNQYGGFGGSSAWYNSPSISTPPFPPGGVYSVNLGDTNLQFNLLDPDASNEQVLLVPTAIVNGGGLLTELRWTYKDADGVTVGPQPFMAGVELHIYGTNAPLYDVGNSDEKLSAATNAHVLKQPVTWSDVSSIQMVLRDIAGSSFASFWLNTPAALQIVTSNLPPGVLGSSYFGALEAFGGVPPYSWSISSGALPPGLALTSGSGGISGAPTNTGTFNFTARVTDSVPNHVDRGYSTTINSSNTPPTISQVGDQTTPQGTATAPIPFTIGDAETPAANLSLSGSSSDQSLARNASVVFAGGGSNRTVRITPEPNKSGSVLITVTVDDGVSTASMLFTVSIEESGPPPATSPNVESYLIIKGQEFIQTNSGLAVVPGASNFMFRAAVSVQGETSISNVTLLLPNSTAMGLPKGERDFKFEQSFSSSSAMDAVYPNGTFTLLLALADGGVKTNRLTLTGNSYPATPHLSNFAAAQLVDPTNDFTLTWDAIAGATTNDFIFLSLSDCHDQEVFKTPSPGQPGTLSATRTSVVIPGRALGPGGTYKLEMLVGRTSQMDTNSLPGALGLAAYFKRLEATLVTIGAPSGCPFGRMNLVFRFHAGGFVGTQGTTSYPQGVEQYQVNFSTENDPSPPATVSFTGPVGSGLNNATSINSGSDNGFAWYGSASFGTPPFPPGGNYTVNYDGTVYPHYLLPPDAANEQVLIVPNLVVNGAGQVTEVNWTYRDTNGAVLPPQPFMRQLRVQLGGTNGNLFPSSNNNNEMPPVMTNVVVDPPVAWADVMNVQMTFRDVAGNEFASDWQRFSASVQIATPALPGGILSNAYSFFISAYGGDTPYSWSISSGSLPPGLALGANTGEIAGTSTALGVFNFTARVTDNSAHQADRSFSIHISASGPDATTYVVAKGRRFSQTSANPPAPDVPGFQFVSFVESEAPGRVSGATLGLPGGLVRTLTNESERFSLEQSFASQDALDAAFANGTYVFTIAAINDGTNTASLLLANNAYPLPPRVGNWGAAQAVDARAEFTLSWNAFSGGSSNDVIIASVMDAQGRELFSTPGYLDRDVLDGTATSMVIPPNTLPPSASLKARLLFIKRAGANPNSYPGVSGLAACFAETAFVLNTLNPAGLLQFSGANYRAVENEGAVEITVNRVGGSEGTVTVGYATSGGSATSADYVPTSGTLTFEPEVTSQTFTVSLLDDSIPEGAETVGLVLTNVTGNAGLGLAFATLTIADDDAPAGPAVKYYIASKGQAFVQTNPGAASLDVEQPFRFGAFVREAFAGGLVSGTLRNPSAVTNELAREGDGDTSKHEQVFTTKAALDAAFKSGLYAFTLNTLNDGTFTPSVTLPADAYPTTPHLANWAAAQSINAFANFQLNWEPFAGGSALDYVQISIRDADTDQDIFRSTDLTEPGALNGTNTSVVIPGGALEPGKSYRGHLLFANLASSNTDGYPGVTGAGAYLKETTFTIATATPPPPQGQLQFAEVSQSVSETNGTATVGLMRAGGSQGAVSVTVSTTNGTATSGADYTGSSHAVSFADGQTSATFTFDIIDDSAYEGPETVKLFLSSPTGGATLAGQTNTTVIIIDDELPPTPGSLQLSAAAYTVAEAAGSLTITVSRSGGSLGEVTVDYETVEGSASGGADYEEASGRLVFPSGVTSRTFTVGINDDDLDETNEVFQVVLSNPSNGATLGVRRAARVTIVDNDTAGMISFAKAAYSVSETNEVAVISVKRSGGLAGSASVDYSASSGTATEGDDFQATGGTLEFEAGETEKFITVPIFDDALPEGDETFSLVLSNPTGGATLGALTNATVTIIDDEVVIQFSRTSYTNSEAAPLVTFTVTRTGPTDDAVTVDYATVDGTALAGEDYRETNGTVVFAAGVSSRTFTASILNGTVAEEDKTFTVTLGNPTGGAQLGERDTATVLIVDNDLGGVINFSAANYTVKETAPFALVTVTRTLGKASDVTVHFEVLDGVGTADAGSDYFTTNGTLTFNAGVTKLTFVVPIRDDAVMEPVETVALRLSNPTGGATLGARSDATVTILDNDVPGAIRFSATAYRMSETGALATITVLRASGKASVSVDYATADGTATAGMDYTATSGTLFFGSNEVTKTFTVPLLADSLPDGNETVLLRLSNPGGGAKLLAPTNATLTISDDELGVQFASAAYTVAEGVSSVVLTVVRAGASATPFTVQYVTADGTALAGSDYTAKTGTLTFGSSVISQTIAIPLRNDTLAEADETFTVTLSNPSGVAQLGPRSVATVTITDADVGVLRARPTR